MEMTITEFDEIVTAYSLQYFKKYSSFRISILSKPSDIVYVTEIDIRDYVYSEYMRTRINLEQGFLGQPSKDNAKISETINNIQFSNSYKKTDRSDLVCSFISIREVQAELFCSRSESDQVHIWTGLSRPLIEDF